VPLAGSSANVEKAGSPPGLGRKAWYTKSLRVHSKVEVSAARARAGVLNS